MCNDDNLYLIWHFPMISISPSKRSLQHEERFAEWLSWTKMLQKLCKSKRKSCGFLRGISACWSSKHSQVMPGLSQQVMLIKFILIQTKQSDLQSIDYYCCKKNQRHSLSRFIINYWQSIADNWDNRVCIWCKSQLS